VGEIREHQRPEKAAVLIPVKPFALAKSRLSTIMSPAERESIARSMLRNVLAASHGIRVAIVAPPEAEDVRRVALVNGARFLPEPAEGGLNQAVQSGVEQLTESGYTRVIVVHSDLPRARDIAWLAETDGVILVPDRTGRGTNAISVPTDAGFEFSYGPGSLDRHATEAQRVGFDPKIVFDPNGLSIDVDEPHDVAAIPDLLAKATS
jgi:2-phospho-L-lactate/phosphoenolpyruvate guanylyltransferase